MNLISTMVGLSIMGAASPVMLDMSLAPIIAQKRAQNLGIAESAAVTYAAANEGETQVAAAPNGCTLNGANAPAYKITCTEGDNQFVQTVSRSFRLAVPPTGSNGSTGSNNGSITFPMNAPSVGEYSHYACPDGDKTLPGWSVDAWGQAYYNRDYIADGKYCIPAPAVGGLDPDDDMSTWLWDLRPVFGNVFDRT